MYQMDFEKTRSINRLCEIYHRADFDPQVDSAAFTLLLSLIGVAPLKNIPQTLQNSLNAFRPLSHQERYNFTMTAISSLLETPSKNFMLWEVFNRMILLVDPVQDITGRAVIESGKLNFGLYKHESIGPLIFQEVGM